jgi:hypothetical protein
MLFPYTAFRFYDNPIYTSQEVNLVASGTDFNLCCDALRSIYGFMASFVRDGLFQEFKVSDIEGLPCIRLLTRYFSKLNTQGFADEMIPADIDPHGVLQSIVSRGKVRYTTDNIVRYRRQVELDDGDGLRCAANFLYIILEFEKIARYKKYPDCKPELFRTGQFVEVQASFKAVRHIKTSRHTFISSFSTLVLLDCGCVTVRH